MVLRDQPSGTWGFGADRERSRGGDFALSRVQCVLRLSWRHDGDGFVCADTDERAIETVMTEAFPTFRTDRIAESGLRELAVLMRGFARRIGAEAYLLFEHRPKTGGIGLIACNWPFDMLAEFGSDGMELLAEPGFAIAPGDEASVLTADTSLPCDMAASMRERGYGSMICQNLPVGDAIFIAVYCASEDAGISLEEAELAQMRAIYALGQRLKSRQTATSPLSVRERECLSWVAEGKTTEEVALILGVSANTINAYVAKAIQKVAATNRAMAIATAIRTGMI